MSLSPNPWRQGVLTWSICDGEFHVKYVVFRSTIILWLLYRYIMLHHTSFNWRYFCLRFCFLYGFMLSLLIELYGNHFSAFCLGDDNPRSAFCMPKLAQLVSARHRWKSFQAGSKLQTRAILNHGELLRNFGCCKEWIKWRRMSKFGPSLNTWKSMESHTTLCEMGGNNLLLYTVYYVIRVLWSRCSSVAIQERTSIKVCVCVFVLL